EVGRLAGRRAAVGEGRHLIAAPQAVELDSGRQGQRHRLDLLVGGEYRLVPLVTGDDTPDLHLDLPGSRTALPRRHGPRSARRPVSPLSPCVAPAGPPGGSCPRAGEPTGRT